MTRRVHILRDNVVQESAAGRDAVTPTGGDAAAGLGELLGTGPLFPVVRRGYDRLAVDGYVDAVEADLAAARQEAHLVHDRYRACAAALVEARRPVDERAAEILDGARAEADARLSNVAALREAARVARDEAAADRAAAADELARARAQAEQWRREARSIRDAAEGEAAARLARLHSQIADLRVERDEALAYLRRLTGQIEQALQSLSTVLPDDASALTDGAAALAGDRAPVAS